MPISFQGTGKIQFESGLESRGNASVLSHCSLLKILEEIRPVYWNIVVMEEPIAGSPFCRAFPYVRILKATRDVDVRFFIHCFTSCSNLCKFCYKFSEIFRSY